MVDTVSESVKKSCISLSICTILSEFLNKLCVKSSEAIVNHVEHVDTIGSIDLVQSESDHFLNVEYYRNAVLEIIVMGSHISQEVYQLRYSLFVQACDTYFKRKEEVLEPFPTCFFDIETKSRCYVELESCIFSIPPLNEINDNTSLPRLAWELILWIFTNPLKIKFKKETEISNYITDELREETKLLTIPYSSKNCKRFKITHPSEINSTKAFLAHKQKYGSFYAYHGSPNCNFHSIIHRGLRCSLNKGSSYGPGTYLTSDIATAKSYSIQYPYRSNVYVAIVEVIKHPSIKVVNVNGIHSEFNSTETKFDDTSSKSVKYYIVNCDEWMLLKHLLVFQ